MGVDITKDDLERFKEFEETILNLKNSGVSYKKDDALEAQIKKEVLYEHFSEEKTDEIMKKLGLDFIDLCDQEIYIKIYRFLESLK